MQGEANKSLGTIGPPGRRLFNSFRMAGLRVHVDVLPSPFYASCRIRGWGAISLKDIENYKLTQVQDALQRLDQALVRLESVAAVVETGKPDAGASAALEEKLSQLNRAHGTLAETAGRVAARLDAAIGRLSASIQD